MQAVKDFFNMLQVIIMIAGISVMLYTGLWVFLKADSAVRDMILNLN